MSLYSRKHFPNGMPVRATVSYGLVSSVKAITEERDLSNNIVRSIFYPDKTNYLPFYNTVNEYMNDKMSRRPITMRNRPVEGNDPGDCYACALKEWKRNGNEPLIVYESLHFFGSVLLTPHAINRDKETGEFYDTITYPEGSDRNGCRPAWIIADPEETKVWLKKWALSHCGLPQPPHWVHTHGSYNFIRHEDKVYVINSHGLSKDGDSERHTLKTVLDL